MRTRGSIFLLSCACAAMVNGNALAQEAQETETAAAAPVDETIVTTTRRVERCRKRRSPSCRFRQEHYPPEPVRRHGHRAASGEDIPLDPDPSKPQGRRHAAWIEARLFALIDLWNAAARKHRPQAFFTPGGERRGLVDLNGPLLSKRLPLAFCDRHIAVEHRPGGVGCARELRAFMKDKPVGHIISAGVEEAYRWKDSVQSAAEIRIWTAGAVAQGARAVDHHNAKPLDLR